MCISGKHSDFMCNKSSIADITSAGVVGVLMGREQGGGFGTDEEVSIHTLMDQGLEDMNLLLLSIYKFEIEEAANAGEMPKRLVAERPSWMILLYFGLL